MIKRYNVTHYSDLTESAYLDQQHDGELMRAVDVLEFLRQLEDTLPGYTGGTYDNDQICDVSWVKTRLQEELE